MKPHLSCCCAKHTVISEDKSLIHFGKSDCCKNTYKFLKLNYQYENSVSSPLLNVALIPYITNLGSVLCLSTEIQDHQQSYQPPPLLLVGKYLIHFIHNLKIPFIISL